MKNDIINLLKVLNSFQSNYIERMINVNIKVVGSTKPNFILSKDEALLFSGRSAGICYLPASVDELFSEPIEKTLKRVNLNISSGHHSVFGHIYYNLIIEDAPKILAMVLNNEKVYNTSEKSAKFTVMKMDEVETELYKKWVRIIERLILREYPKMGKHARKLAQENARYFISVFTPATTMEYTVNLRQLSLIVNWAKDYIKNEEENPFSSRMKNVLEDFLDKLPDINIPEINDEMKARKFSLFAARKRDEHFGETYSVNYCGSLTYLAQAQRHRTLSYEMAFCRNPFYFVPTIVKQSDRLKWMWIEDMKLVSNNYPQALMVDINERGTVEDFILKCMERMCGAAQHETMKNTESILHRYMRNVRDVPNLHDYLATYDVGARCNYPNWKCNSPCVFGKKEGTKRLV